jgi:hypothetical protein
MAADEKTETDIHSKYRPTQGGKGQNVRSRVMSPVQARQGVVSGRVVTVLVVSIHARASSNGACVHIRLTGAVVAEWADGLADRAGVVQLVVEHAAWRQPDRGSGRRRPSHENELALCHEQRL